MPVYLCFITKEENTCRLIMERLESAECRCFLQTDWVGLYRSLQDYECRIDMIICDFALVGSSYFNLAQSIREMGKKIPVIYYNEPVSDEQRVNHWINQYELSYSSTLNQKQLDVLSVLNKVICDPSIRRHISLLQPALPVGYEKQTTGNNLREIDLLQFRLRKNLTPVMFQLFEFFYKNRKRDISIREIGKVLFKKRRFFLCSRATVYAYISRLRCLIENDLIVKIKIIRSSPGRYRMIVY